MAQNKLQNYTGPGSQQFEITHDDYVKGMTSSDDMHDGGFSSRTFNINLISSLGIVYPTKAYSSLVPDGTSTITGAYMLASATAGTTGEFVFIDSIGNYYAYDSVSNKYYFKQTDNTASAYSDGGVTDMVRYYNSALGSFYYYTSTATDLTVWDGSATSGSTHFDKNWWTSTKAQPVLNNGARHPLLVGPTNLLYIGDKNVLRSIDTAGNITSAPLTLSADQEITALGYDPGSGKMLVAVSVYGSSLTENLANLNNVRSYIGVYDGVNPVAFQRMIPVDGQINAFYNLGGQVYVTYGQKFGVFNGSGITFLRNLAVTLDKKTLAYKQRITSINNTLYIAEGNNVLAYGEIIGGKEKIFYYPFSKSALNPDYPINSLGYLGNNQLAIGAFLNSITDGQIVYFDVTAKGTDGTCSFYSIDYHMPRPVFIRAIDVALSSKPTTGTHTFTLITDTNSNVSLGAFGSTTSSTNMHRFYCTSTSKTTTVQLKDVVDSCNAGLRRVIIYFDYAE